MARIIIPNFPSADSFVDNVSFTLRAMGHEVIAPQAPFTSQRHPILRRVNRVWSEAFPHTWTAGEKWLAKTVQETSNVDLVLCLTQSLRAEVLQVVRKEGTRQTACWWGDAPVNIPANGLMADEWDAIFIKDKAASEKLSGLGLAAEHLDEAMNPHWHKRVFTTVGEEVAIAGNYYGYRQKLVLRLLENKVPIALFGFAPPRWADPRIAEHHSGRYVVREEKSEVFGSSIAALNSTSLTEADSINCRAFEIAGACGLQLIEDKPSVHRCFEPGREVLCYRGIDDILAHLEMAKADPVSAMKIREAGWKRALAEHTYQHRLTHILQRLKVG